MTDDERKALQRDAWNDAIEAAARLLANQGVDVWLIKKVRDLKSTAPPADPRKEETP